jgi:tRNA(fMet)-specific endonuclease VapC
LILLDSNTLIQYLKGYQGVVDRLQRASPSEVVIPSIVAYEVGYGALRVASSRRRNAVMALLDALGQVPFDGNAARESAKIRLDLESRGQTIGPMDLLIAGTARTHSAVLVTNNVKEFSRVKGLRIEDWTKTD